jgi:hypothetical protein
MMGRKGHIFDFRRDDKYLIRTSFQGLISSRGGPPLGASSYLAFASRSDRLRIEHRRCDPLLSWFSGPGANSSFRARGSMRFRMRGRARV